MAKLTTLFAQLVCASVLLGPIMAQAREKSPELLREIAKQESIATLTTIGVCGLGNILTDGNGRTLYRYAGDLQLLECEEWSGFWRPLLLIGGEPSLACGVPGHVDTIKRNDDTRQVTYNCMPLWYFLKDAKPGDAFGNKLEASWFVINPCGK